MKTAEKALWKSLAHLDELCRDASLAFQKRKASEARRRNAIYEEVATYLTAYLWDKCKNKGLLYLLEKDTHLFRRNRNAARKAIRNKNPEELEEVKEIFTRIVAAAMKDAYWVSQGYIIHMQGILRKFGPPVIAEMREEATKRGNQFLEGE